MSIWQLYYYIINFYRSCTLKIHFINFWYVCLIGEQFVQFNNNENMAAVAIIIIGIKMTNMIKYQVKSSVVNPITEHLIAFL